MGKIIDIDKVLEIKMSQRARDKVIALETTPVITYDGGRDAWSLACVLLCAFRYGRGRHFTQCLTSMNFDKVVEQNLDILPDDFLRQMICGIHDEFRIWDIRCENNEHLFNASPMYLEPFLKMLQEEYVRRGNKEVPLEEWC